MTDFKKMPLGKILYNMEVYLLENRTNDKIIAIVYRRGKN